MASSSNFEHLTSNTILEFGFFFRISSLNRIICISGKIISPEGDITPNLSASPSNANPISDLFSETDFIRSLTFSSFEGSG